AEDGGKASLVRGNTRILGRCLLEDGDDLVTAPLLATDHRQLREIDDQCIRLACLLAQAHRSFSEPLGFAEVAHEMGKPGRVVGAVPAYPRLAESLGRALKLQ